MSLNYTDIDMGTIKYFRRDGKGGYIQFKDDPEYDEGSGRPVEISTNAIMVHAEQWETMKRFAKKMIIKWNHFYVPDSIKLAEPDDEEVELYAKRIIAGMYGDVLDREIVVIHQKDSGE